jgi:hypothetical protein
MPSTKTAQHSPKIRGSLLKKNATKEQAFVLCTGAVITNVKQLADELDLVDDSAYYYHTPAGRNDFANWVQDVFNDNTLAVKLRQARGKDHARAAIYRYLIELS